MYVCLCVCVCIHMCSVHAMLCILLCTDVRQSLRRVSELEALANSLSESVKEKSIALSHQKKANK